MTGRSIVRVRRPAAVSPSVLLGDKDRDLLYTDLLMEARTHALRLCGRIQYSHAQVLPCESAAVIFRLLAIIGELQGCKSVRKHKELQASVREQHRELLRLWKVEAEYNAMRDAQAPALDVGA